MTIANNLKKIQAEIGEKVKLIAVSKYHTNKEVLEAYEVGQRDFGENRVQDLDDRKDDLPDDIRWHFIGNLQRNKVKFIAPYIHYIHSVDSARLLREINKQAKKENRVIPCLLQLKIAREDSKSGLTEDEIIEILEDPKTADLKNIEINGLMGMATFTEDKVQLNEEFEKVKHLFNKLQNIPRMENVHIREMSMGMSQDYEIALANGSTMVRIGSTIFNA